MNAVTRWGWVYAAALTSALAGCGNGDDNAVPAPDAAADASANGGDAKASDGSIDAGDATLDAPVDGAVAVARGRYLVEHVLACGDCHTRRDAMGMPDTSKWLAGNPGLFQVPGVTADGGVGIVSPSNLTPDMATGLGSWSDQQIKVAMLDGTDKNGSALFPIMPYFVFHNMSDDDANAIVAYLRSIPPVSNAVPAKDFMLPQPAAPLPDALVPDPTLPATDPNYVSAMRGKYLAGSAGACIECHTAHLTGGPMVLDTAKLFGGGDQFPSAALGLPPTFPPIINSENITQDSTGISGWPASAVLRVIKQGIDDQGVPICPPMPVGPNGAFGGMTDSDALDIANYIVHLPPVSNVVAPICHDTLASEQDAGSDAARADGSADAAPADAAPADGSADASSSDASDQ